MLKFDGVIEAVRYKNGKIEVVRAYERRGATFSDRILLNRKSLLERLSSGKHFVTGQRREFMASTLEVEKEVKAVGPEGQTVLTTSAQAERDELEGVPVVPLIPCFLVGFDGGVALEQQLREQFSPMITEGGHLWPLLCCAVTDRVQAAIS